MTEADIVLMPLPQADGIVKNRPALLLRQLPRSAISLPVVSALNSIMPSQNSMT
jgi:hypothetical protein